MRRAALALFILVLLLPLCCCRSRRESQARHHTTQNTIPSSTANAIIREAERWIGTPYRYGAQTRRKGTDCSGMTMVIFRDKAGVQLPRNSAAQQQACMLVRRSELQPGDLIFFSSSKRGGRVNHVGIYRGNGEFIHASSSRGVMVSRLDQKYFDTHYHSAGRVRELATVQPKGGKNKDRRGQSAPAPVAPPAPVAGPPSNYVEIIFGADTLATDFVQRPDTVGTASEAGATTPQTAIIAADTLIIVRDSIPEPPADLWHRAEAQLDSIISSSLDSLETLQ